MKHKKFNKKASRSVLSLVLTLLISVAPQLSNAASDDFSNHPYNHNHLFVVQSSHYYNVSTQASKSTISASTYNKKLSKNSITYTKTEKRKELSWYQWLISSSKTPNLHFLNLLELIGA